MLKDLHELGVTLQNSYQTTFTQEDKELPVIFKQLVNNIEGSAVNYNRNSFVVTVNYSNQKIYFPNQLWYIAAYFADFYKALTEYAQIIKNNLHISDENIKKAKDNKEIASSLILHASVSDDDKEYLIRFLYDYNWWYGGKGIERADYYVSPILSLSKLVNASQSYVADLCKFLAKNEDALNVLKQVNEQREQDSQKSHSNYTTEISSYLSYLTALRTKPFMLLAGISGTGKSRIVRKLAQATNTKEYAKEEDRWKDNRPDNFQLIQVKPNWHNSMDVVGFLSNIPEPHYVFTDFVRFIVKAWQHPETPYFLCLDEMNLAPVEEYFAEFLSAIESRAWDEDGNYTTDPIISPFKDYGKKVCEAMLKELLGEAHHTETNPLAIQFENKGLTLPPNLMVMGTVNMDETTFSFSRKVLDRAMSVEMNEVNYDDFKEGKTELMPLLTDYNDLLVNRPQKAQEVQGEIDSQKVIDYLKAVNELLDGTPFKLGYRAANEAILYVAASQEFAKEAFSIETAMDEFTLMKILSRIEGDDSRLAIDENDERLLKAGLSESPLDNGEQNLTLLNGLRAIVRLHIGANTETEKKINHMYTTLCREHFVSYWA